MNSLKRTFQVLELVADEPEGIPFNELRRRCGDLAPTTMSRLLQAMVRDELLDKERETGNYVLGGGFLALAWLIPVGIAVYCIKFVGISAWYFPLPCWIACGLLYLLLSGRSSSSTSA